MTKPNRQAPERKIRPDKKLQDLGEFMYLIAQTHADALAHLHQQLALCDGHGVRGEQAAVTTSGISNPTASAAMGALELERRIEEQDTLKKDLGDMARRVLWNAQNNLRYQAPRDEPVETIKLCCDGLNDTNRAGAVEWHDPTCTARAQSRGLCRKHFDAMRYWRTTHGLNPIPDDTDPVTGTVRSMVDPVFSDGHPAVVHVHAPAPVRDGYAGAVHVSYVRVESA